MNHCEEMPVWAKELYSELREISKALKKIEIEKKNEKENDRDYYDFIKRFRKRMQADPVMGHYPEIVVDGRRIGVSFAGLLYDKDNGETLDRPEAFEIYKIVYREYCRARKEAGKVRIPLER